MRLNEARQHADDDQDNQQDRQRDAFGQSFDRAIAAAFVGHHVIHAGTEIPDDGNQENDDQDLAGHVGFSWRGETPANRQIIVAAKQPRRWHRPSGLAIALACFGIALFTWLGFWQLQRAADKEVLLAAFAGASQNEPIAFSAARRMPADSVYPHVRLRGHYDQQHDYVLDDQVRDGRQGVIVFSPFTTADDSFALLVNRGFIARDDYAKAPVIPALPEGEVELSGLYAPPPGSGLRLGGNALPGQPTWPKLSIHIDTAEIGEDLGHPIDSRVILLDADPASGFMREWTPQIIPPERHRGYAVQWFGFVVATLVIFVVLHWRRDKKGPK